MELTLTVPEKFVLRETVEAAIKELLGEIARTDHRKMRDELKEREELMNGILAKLAAEERSAA